jgi:BCD family chlorophyll transporter-like MFS transporter
LGPGPYPAFALVLLVELILSLGALVLLERVNVHRFRQDTGRSLARVLSLEIG